MITIYEDYGDEPEDQFAPLPEDLACIFYDLELESYQEDITFFDNLIPTAGHILELGCGSGRVGRRLSHNKRIVTGIDISLTRLKRGQKLSSSSINYVAMDMAKIAFTCLFDAIVVPYNSLNLLLTKERIVQCLKDCQKHLHPGSLLIAQIFIPTKKFLSEEKKTFQFQIFDKPEGGRLIKEILKEYHPDSDTISIEERYRFRPADRDATADYNDCYMVAAYSADTWLDMIQTGGFQILSCSEDFNKTPIGSTDSSSLVVVCNASS